MFAHHGLHKVQPTIQYLNKTTQNFSMRSYYLLGMRQQDHVMPNLSDNYRQDQIKHKPLPLTDALREENHERYR